MNLFRFLFLPVLLVTLAVQARAEVLIGLGNISGFTGPNLEWAGERTSYYVMPGIDTDSTGLHTLHWIAGLRHRIDYGLSSTTGFYTGAIVGDLGGNNDYNRYGAGGTLGYQWVKEYTRITLDSSLLVLERKPEAGLEEEPRVVLGVTISLRK